MTVDEAIQKANAGDVDTMNTLADYYYQEENNTSEAIIWLRRAADCGSFVAAYKAVILIELTAAIDMAHAITRKDSTDFWKSALANCNLGISYCGKLLDSSKPENVLLLQRKVSDDKTFLDSVIEKYHNLSFRKAQCYLELKQFDNVINYTDDEAAPNFMMLRGLAFYGQEYSDAIEGLQALGNATVLWKSVFDSDYVPSDEGTEQVEFARAVHLYAYNLRAGIGCDKDVESSYRLLTAQLPKIEEPNAKSLLENDLSHFQIKKGFFGTSITYID